MVDAVTLDFGGSPLADFSMPDASGLVPLSLPEAVPNGNQKPLQQPSPEAVRRFQEAMKAPVSPVTLEPLRRVAEQKSVAVETVERHETIVDGGEVETMDTPRVSRPVPNSHFSRLMSLAPEELSTPEAPREAVKPAVPKAPRRAAEPQIVVVETVVRHETIDTPRVSRPVPQSSFTPQRETTHVVTEAAPAATRVAGAAVTPVVDKPAIQATPVAVPMVEVPVRPVVVPVVDESVRLIAVPVTAPIAEEPVATPIAAEAPRKAAEQKSVVVETVVAEASPAPTRVAVAVAMPAAQATPVVNKKPATPVAPVAVPVVEAPVTQDSIAVAAPVGEMPVRPVAVPVAAPIAEEPVATPIAAEALRRAADPQSVVVETVVRHETIDESGEVETIDMSRVSRPVPQTPSTPQRETTHVVTEASSAAAKLAEVVATPSAQATPVVDKPVMPAAPIAVPVVEVPVRPVVASVAAPVSDVPVTPVAVPVAAPVVDESVRPIAAPVTAPIAEGPVITPIAAEISRRAAEPQSVVVETVVRHEAKADGGEVETIETFQVSRSVPPSSFTPQRETTHVATEASPAATQVVGVVAMPAAQATPVVDKPVMPTAPVAVPVVEVPVRPVVASVAAPGSDAPVTPVAVPVVAPIAEELVTTPIAAEAPRKAAEPQSVVVETVVRQETKADGGEVETIETSRVSRPVPPSSFTPQRETTHVVIEASPAATQVAGAVATPAAQVTPVVDRPAIQAAPVAAPVVNEPVTPVAIPIAAPVVEVPVRPVVASVAAPVADMPVTPVAASVAAPVVDEPVAPVAVPVAAPIAEEPVITPVAAESPRRAAEPQSVVVETVVRHETIAEGGEVETMAAPRVPRPVPQTLSTPSREATHVVAKTPDEQETVLQAAPVVAAPPEYLTASAPLREDGISVAAATARTEVIVETVNKMVEAVVGQISVTPSLVKGEGEVHMTLKPTVLDGSDITLTAKDGTLTVAITPATPEAVQSAAAALPRLEAALAEHVAAFHHVSVALVAKKGKTDETA